MELKESYNPYREIWEYIHSLPDRYMEMIYPQVDKVNMKVFRQK